MLTQKIYKSEISNITRISVNQTELFAIHTYTVTLLPLLCIASYKCNEYGTIHVAKKLGFVANIKLLKPQSNHRTFEVQHKLPRNSHTIIHNNNLRSTIHVVVHQCITIGVENNYNTST